MIKPISSVELLRETTQLISLARRAAMNSTDPAMREKALQLAPVAQEIKAIAKRESPTPPVSTVSAPEFQTLIQAASKKHESRTDDHLDRITLVLGMAQGGASPVEIARTFGLTRGEVELMLNVEKQK
ncbi:MAG: hypothetical protein AAB571_04380 [Chloroflexota bacterium]